MAEIVMLPIDHLIPHPDNPRKELGDLTELADSIRSKGVLQNLTVIPHPTLNNGYYFILIGHRRHAAAELAGLKELPCTVVEMSYEDQIATMLVENMQRSDLTVWEEGKGLQMMMNLGKSVREVSEMTGFSETKIRSREKLARLDEKKVKKALSRGATLFDFAELEAFDDPEEKAKLLDALGTADFKNLLSKFKSEKRNRELLVEWEGQISRWAVKIDDSVWGTPYAKMLLGGKEILGRYYRNYGTWNQGKNAVIEKPKDADRVQYYFKVSGSQIDVYSAVDAESVSKEEAAQAEKQRKRDEFDAKKAKFAEMTARHRQLRQEFIKGFRAFQKKDTNVWEFISEALIEADIKVTSYGYQQDARMEALAEWLGITYSKPARELPYHEFLTLKQSEPERTALLIAYFMMDYGSFWDTRWNVEKQAYEIVWKDNPRLEKCVKLLTWLGYSESREEIKMRRGSLEDFDVGSDGDIDGEV